MSLTSFALTQTYRNGVCLWIAAAAVGLLVSPVTVEAQESGASQERADRESSAADRAPSERPDEADAEEPPEPGAEDSSQVEPALMHSPVGDAAAGAKLTIRTSIEGDWHLDRTYAAIRPVTSSDAEDWETYAFERADSDTFLAEIPGVEVQPPGLEYYIASETDGERRLHFASPDQPHPIVVRGETAQTRFRDRLARHEGYRSTFELSGEMSRYGGRIARPDELPDGRGDDDIVTEPFTDQYWKAELEYTYRVLSTLYDIRFGLGLMRGTYPKATIDGETIRVSPSGAGQSPGLNYGYGMATFELLRNFSLSGKLMLGASAEGFAPGAGAIARIGRLGGTRAVVGVDVMGDVGVHQYFAFRWDTVPRVPMGFVVELSDWPADEDNPTGSRIIYELGVRLSDPLEAGLRAGVATRRAGTSSGFVGGLNLSYSL